MNVIHVEFESLGAWCSAHGDSPWRHSQAWRSSAASPMMGLNKGRRTARTRRNGMGKGQAHLVLALVLGASAFCCVPDAVADIFKYVDEHGRVFLTDRPDRPDYKLLVRTWEASSAISTVIVPDLPIKSNWHMGKRTGAPYDCGGSNGYVRSNAAQRDACREWLKARGYTHILATPAGSDFDFYRGTGSFSAKPCTGVGCILPSSGRVGFKSLLDETIADGMGVVVFLTKDDSPGNREIPDWVKQDTVGPATTLSNNFKAFIVHINPSVSSWILGLESNEYWKPCPPVGHIGYTSCTNATNDVSESHRDSNLIGQWLRSKVGSKKIGTHAVPDLCNGDLCSSEGSWIQCAGRSWCSYFALQSGFANPATGGTAPYWSVAFWTTRARSQSGKTVVTMEYDNSSNEATARAKGNAALNAGSAGYGDGGGAGL